MTVGERLETAGDRSHVSTPALRWRPDVEGLRAVAIGLVVSYHAGIPLVPGGFIGVDVFFVISGFLITGLLVSEVHRSGTVSLAGFWARRARRLLPAAALVLVVVAALSWLVVPVIDHPLVGGDIVASALYASNIRFALQATDYLGADRAPSPVLNYWSLGVEEQFYVVWPLLVLLVGVILVARWKPARERASRSIAIALLVVGALSFWFSLRLTTTSEPWAFFGMPTRAWEFAVGGLVAIATLAGFALTGAVRAVVGWVGLIVVVVAAMRITAEVPYPGTAAIWPVLGTAAILVAGAGARSTTGASGLLATSPMRAVGRLSYSWYLWHWPILVLMAAWLGPLSVPAKCALVLAALVPSVLAYRWVERPIHHAPTLVESPRRSLLMGAAVSGVAVVAGALLTVMPGGGAFAATPVAVAEVAGRPMVAVPSGQPSGAPSSRPTPTALPAVALAPPLTGDAIRPDPVSAREDLPVIYGNGCHLTIPDTVSPDCVFGDRTSSTTVVLLGDSHAAQWFPALDRAAATQGWRLVSLTKSGCPAGDVTVFLRSLKRPYTECDDWRRGVMQRLTGSDKPALVVATSTATESVVDRNSGERLSTQAAGAEWQAGWRRTLRQLSGAGVPVAVLRDTPWPGIDMATCVAGHRNDPSACDLDVATLASPSFDVDQVAGIRGAHAVDLTSSLCTQRGCPAVIGPLLVYRDDSHLTATFSESLASRLAAELKPLVNG